jgi:co-chaperonin GroES (HSP10)
MSKNKVTRKIESDMLLNLKDIEAAKKENINTKQIAKAKTLDSSLEKYNESYVKAWEAPVPDITLHYNEVLVRAVPIEVKTKSGIIVSASMSDIQMADKLERMSHAVQATQEIIMVGNLITKEEQESGLRAGRMARINFDRYRTLSDRHQPGMAQTEYSVPVETIDGYKYIIIDKRDIVYTTDLKED